MDKVICTNCGENNTIKSKYCKSCGHELPKIEIENIDDNVNQKPTKRTEGNKKLIGSILGIIFFGLSYFLIQQFFFKPPSFDKVMMTAASELNKTCPIMVDQYTRLDNAIALPDNSFQYNYTLINMDKSEVSVDTAKKYLLPNIINNVKTNPDLKIYRDNKTTMIYNYKDKNGVFIVKFSITPDMYK